MKRIAVGLLGAMLIASAVQAQQPGGIVVHLHGFGNWSYGRTNGNEYLSGNRAGNYKHMDFSLNTAAELTDHLRIVSQVGWDDPGTGGDVALDFAFASWRVSNHAEFRAGKVKMPFGISVETFDVGSLRPFTQLPTAIYAPVGFYAEAFNGIAVTGTLPALGRWELNYDVYAGGMELPVDERPLDFLRGVPDSLSVDEEEPMRNAVGGRLLIATPLEGLRVGFSAFTAVSESDSLRRSAFAGLAEFTSGGWQLRAELAHAIERGDESHTGGYVQVAWRFTRHWQVAALYDRLTTRLQTVPSPTVPSLLRHEEWGLALNYWLHQSFVLKSSILLVNGNRIARPPSSELFLAAQNGTLKPRTSLFELGVAFAF